MGPALLAGSLQLFPIDFASMLVTVMRTKGFVAVWRESGVWVHFIKNNSQIGKVGGDHRCCSFLVCAMCVCVCLNLCFHFAFTSKYDTSHKRPRYVHQKYIRFLRT